VVSQRVFIADVAGVYFSEYGSAPIPKFLNPTRVTIIDPTVIQTCFYLRKTAQTPATAEMKK